MTDADLARWEAEVRDDRAPSRPERLLALIAEVRRLRALNAPVWGVESEAEP